jgi:glyoxylase I family protein
LPCAALVDIAFRTADINALKRRLQEKGIFFPALAPGAMSGREQICLFDPEGDVIEAHQLRS